MKGQGAGDGGRGTTVVDVQPSINTFKDLRVWQEGVELVKEVYALSVKFPKDEIYGLVSQMKRAAVSVPSNIAEGHSRNHRAEYRQFVYVSVGSLAELETQLLLAKDLRMTAGSDMALVLGRIDRLRGMLITLARRLA